MTRRLHDIDSATWFCKACGASLTDIERVTGADCPGGGNVIGISHRRVGERPDRIAEANRFNRRPA